MVIILCDDFKEATDSFETFVNFLENTQPWTITSIEHHANSVLTDDDIRYLFIDYHYLLAFRCLGDEMTDIIDCDLFLEDLYAYW